MAKKTRLNKPSIIIDDKQYLDEYFQICDLLSKRHKLKKGQSRENDFFADMFWAEFDGPRSPAAIKEKNREIEERLSKLSNKEKYERLTRIIARKDKMFWKKVKQARKTGREFIIEKFTAHYSLDMFEKKLILMFFFLELTDRRQDPLEISEILQLVGIDDSAFERMRKAIYFNDDRPLLKNEFLKKNFMRYENKVAYKINFAKIRCVSQMLNGEKVNLTEIKPKTANMEELCKAVGEVGYAKAPEFSWTEVALKDETREKVRFFLDPCNEGVSLKSGTVFLFYGPPGTGKSMLAEAIASYLGKNIMALDFSKVMNKYVGETEKQISKVFAIAKEKDMVLVINEADSLLMSRSMMRWEWGIRETNMMLTELENFKGVAVLTTNMDVLLDTALERRVNLKIKFEVPDETLREEIWQKLIPKEAQLALDVNFEELANKYEFSGGYIKNAVQNAYRKALARKSNILTMADLVFGADLEKDGMFTKANTKHPIGFGN